MTDLVKRLTDLIETAFDLRIGNGQTQTPSILVRSQRRELAEIAAKASATITAAPESVPTLGKCFECDGELSVWCPACNASTSPQERRDEWLPMHDAPQDRFIILLCPEDGSRWWAKWQVCEWHGIDEEGCTRTGGYHEGSERATGWRITGWQEIPVARRAKGD